MNKLNNNPQFDESLLEALSFYRVIKSKNLSFIIHLDGSLSIVGEYNALSDDMSLIEMEKIAQTLSEGILKVDPAISLQFMLKRKLANKIEDAKVTPLTKSKIDNLKRLKDNYELFSNKYFIALHLKAEADEKQNENFLTRIMGKFNKTEGDQSKQLEKFRGKLGSRMDKLHVVSEEAQRLMKEIGVDVSFYDKDDQYFDLFKEFLRPAGKEMKTKMSTRTSLLAGVDIKVKKKDFILDGYFHKLWTLDRTPIDLGVGKIFDAVATVPFEFSYSITLAKDPKEDRVNLSANFFLKMEEKLREKQALELKVSREQISRNYEDKLIESVFSQLGGTEWITEELFPWQTFCNVIPGFSSVYNNVLKLKKVKKELFPFYLPLYGLVQKYEDHGVNYFLDFRGCRVLFDLKDKGKHNHLIIGPKGAGKSSLIQTLITYQLDLSKEHVYILNEEGADTSYDILWQALGGKKIILDRKTLPNINLFALPEKDKAPTLQKSKQIMAVLELMLSTNPNRLDAYVEFSYEEILSMVNLLYKNHKKPTMKDFIATVKEHMDDSGGAVKKLVSKLKPFAKDGDYPYFDKETNLDLEDQLILVDIKNLSFEPLLQKLYYLMVNQALFEKVLSNKELSLVIKDESPTFWSLTDSYASKAFVEEFKLSSKNNCINILVLSQMEKLFQTGEDLGEKLFSLMDRIILAQFDRANQVVDADQFLTDRTIQVFKFPLKEWKKLKLLGPMKKIAQDGSAKVLYNNFLVMDQKSHHMFYMKNVMHPFENYLFAIDPQLKSLIAFYLSTEGKKLTEVLEFLSQGQHLGDEKLAVYLDENGMRDLARKVRNKAV